LGKNFGKQVCISFQTVDYYNFLKVTTGFDGDVFAVYNEEEIAVLIVITILKEPGLKRLFSGRGTIFGGPLINRDLNNELKELLSFLILFYRRKLIYLETRNYFDYSDFKETFVSSGWKFKPHYNVQISLEGMSQERIMAKFKYNRRREIRQSFENGATFRKCANIEEVGKIYEILREIYRNRAKVPLPSISFFINLFKTKFAEVFVVEHNGEIIGGSFCPVIQNKAIYTFYYCGLRNYHPKIFPNHLAIYAVIEYALENNLQFVDLMGGGRLGHNDGIRRYKLEFGAEQYEYGRFIKVINPIYSKSANLV
jgi:serine/alanine adding enzyme